MKSLRSRSWLFSDVFSCLSVASLDSRQCNLQILIFDFPYYLKSLEVCRTWEFRILKRSLNLFLLRLLSAMTHPTLILLPLAGKGLWTLFAAVGDPIPTLLASLAAMSSLLLYVHLFSQSFRFSQLSPIIFFGIPLTTIKCCWLENRWKLGL